MQRQAAAKIDRGIGKMEAPTESHQATANRAMTDFKAQRGKHRCWGSGYLGQRKGGRWAGQYTVKWPDGRKETRSVYASTEEECERLLAEMITAMKTELAAEKERLRTENKVSVPVRWDTPAGWFSLSVGKYVVKERSATASKRK